MVAFLPSRRKLLSFFSGAIATLTLAACDVPAPSEIIPDVGGDATRSVPVALLVPQ